MRVCNTCGSDKLLEITVNKCVKKKNNFVVSECEAGCYHFNLEGVDVGCST